MNQEHFKLIVSNIASTLRISKACGEGLSNDFIEKTVDEQLSEFKKKLGNFNYVDTDVERLKFELRTMFNVIIDDPSIVLRNPEAERWFDNKKSTINWDHWNAYKEMLLSGGRSPEVIDKNEEVIDAVLDFSSDPTRPEPWARKGLVMGNVQSGKTQNYLGLINKGIDAGYKVIILLGGHLKELRDQTQQRVDEGVLGRESKHIIEANIARAAPIGVGLHGAKTVNAGTTTKSDFTKASARSLGITLNNDSVPFIFTIKKNTTIMKSLRDWIIEHHFLDLENGKKMDAPLLFIDDESDYASINTKHHKEEITQTNNVIRELLSLFNRSTYVAYTATPFANIFIDPDENSYSDQDDLFPSDFMIKLPTPSDYMGQDFFFGGIASDEKAQAPVEEITDHWPIFELKKDNQITVLPESLKQAIRAFIIVIAIRNLRGEGATHNTMLVNISHLKVHQDTLEFLIEEYRKSIYDALHSFSNLGLNEAKNNALIKSLMETFNSEFEVGEDFDKVFSRLTDSVGKVKVWAINQGTKSIDNKALDYLSHKAYGLNVIVIGGHKLSRGLTLENLSISYFARNSKGYDTLMQMCRWFGYRQAYKDLCKVYLPTESLDWYSFITLAINELYSELELMSKSQKRPSEFGMKVREHPGAMIITAKNKIGYSTSQIRSQSLWGQVQRRFVFFSSKEKNERNVAYAEQFFLRLLNKRPTNEAVQSDEGKPFVFEGVEYSELINFIKNIDLPEDDVGNDALIKHLEGMQEAGLPKVKVVLYTQPSIGKTKWEENLPAEEDKVFINTKFSFGSRKIVMPKRRMQFNGNYSNPNAQLGNSDDEKLFLSPSAISKVKENCKHKKNGPISFDYIASPERDFPGLIIYLFSIGIIKPWGKSDNQVAELGHGLNPTLGYSISLPRAEEIKGKTQKEITEIIKSTKYSYSLNKVHSRYKEIFDYTENYDDDDE